MRIILIITTFFTFSVNAQNKKNLKIENLEIHFYTHECWSKSGLLTKETSESGNKSAVCAAKGLLTERPLYKTDRDLEKNRPHKHVCYENQSGNFNSVTIFSANDDHQKSCKAEGLVHDISLLHNGTNCTQFSNKFLSARGLGSIGKPSDKVRAANFGKANGVPEFNVEGKNGDRVSSKAIVKNIGTNWTLTIESQYDVPALEQGFVTGKNIFNKGDYKRTYNFEVIGGSCVVRSIDIEFLPLGKNETVKSKATLTKSECEPLAKLYTQRTESFTAKSDLIDGPSLNEFTCHESLALFSEPHNAKDSLLLKKDDKKDEIIIRGTR